MPRFERSSPAVPASPASVSRRPPLWRSAPQLRLCALAGLLALGSVVGACGSDAESTAEAVPPLLAQDLAPLIRAAALDAECGFLSAPVLQDAVYDADGARASLIRTVDRCQIFFSERGDPDTLLDTDCDDEETRATGILAFSGKSTTVGQAGTDASGNPTVVANNALHTTYNLELEFNDVIVESPYRDEQLQLVRGLMKVTARPRFAVDIEGGCGALTNHMTLENIQWTRGGVVVFGGGLETLEGDVQSSSLQAQVGSGPALENSIHGTLSVKAESFVVAEDADSAVVVDERFDGESFDAVAFDALYSCRDEFSKPVSFACEGATVIGPRPE